VTTGDENFFGRFMDDYFAECDEHLAIIRDRVLALERLGAHGGVDRATLDDLFRSFHSIKGISGMVELREAELLAHELENYLRALRDEGLRLTGEGADALIEGVDLLDRTIAARREGTALPSPDAVIQRLGTVAGSSSSAEPTATPGTSGPAASWRVVFVPSAESAARGVNVDSVRIQLRAAGTIVSATPKVLADGIAFEFLLAAEIDEDTAARWREQGLTVEPVTLEPVPPAANASGRGARGTQPSHVVRVDLSRLDELMRIIGDLVISRARLEDSLGRIAPHVPPVEWRAVQENAAAIERQLRDLRDGVVRVRLVPVGEIFQRMPFVVRDLSREQGKRVQLEIEGQDTEIDKFLVERMLDPIVHLVRNAVSHGIETPEGRARAGKSPDGRLRLSAAGIGDSVILEIADDGAGLDVEAIIARGRAAGLPVPEDPQDTVALLDLICTPGFSTRDVADLASGRGVGMSVVKSTVQELNGTLSLYTAPGQGTRYVVELPLTLSITDALVAQVGDRTFAVPQSAVREVVEIETASLRPVGRQELVPFRTGALPILRLSRLFRIENARDDRLHVFVIGSGQEAVGLAVDRIIGQREIVVRTMADALIRVDGVSGATDLGDGRAVLILDPVALARRGMGFADGVRA
jgi:two-component system, chemotaxis family, sensor kinase CheA